MTDVKALIKRLREMEPEANESEVLGQEAADALEEMEETITELQIQHSKGLYTPLHEADRKRLQAELAEERRKLEEIERENKTLRDIQSVSDECYRKLTADLIEEHRKRSEWETLSYKIRTLEEKLEAAREVVTILEKIVQWKERDFLPNKNWLLEVIAKARALGL